MVSRIRLALLIQLCILPALEAQPASRWAVRGDTSGAPAGCSVSAAKAAITDWFTAFHTADSARLASVTPAAPSGFVFSTGKFKRTDTFVRIESFRALLAYARERMRHHEALRLRAVRFFGWHERDIGFMPFYLRSADDLGPAPLRGVGKAGYRCGRGIVVLNLAPVPPDVPGLWSW